MSFAYKDASHFLFRLRFLMFLLFVFFAPSLAHACSCFGPAPVCSAWRSGVVFRGRVLSQTLDDGEFHVRFAVMESFRGATQSREITVQTAEQGSACGFEFEIGREYLVYSQEVKGSEEVFTSHCSRTHLIEPGTDDPDVIFLRGIPTMPNGGTISGTVHVHPDQPTLSPAGTIKIRGPANRDVVPDEEGKYEVAGLPPGKYTVTAVFPPGIAQTPDDLGTTRTAELIDKSCVESNYFIVSDGHVRGTITDFNGKPMGEVYVVLYLSNADFPGGRRETDAQVLGKDGRFDFAHVPPGDYVVSANDLGPDPNNPYPRVYYSAAGNDGQPTLIHVAAAQRIDELDIAFPKPWRLITVPVRVLLPDDAPAVDAQFDAYDSDYQSSGQPFVASPDSRGRATISVYEGRTYFLTAYINGENQRCGGPFKFVAKPNLVLEPIVIEHNWGNCLAQLDPGFVPPQ
jgi:hypothetical protein